MTRREWAFGALAFTAELDAAWQHAHDAASPGSGARLEYLNEAAAREVEAIASAILPSDGSPGAWEAGVLYFIDRALSGWDRDKRGIYEKGLAELKQIRTKMFPNAPSSAALSEEQLHELVTAIEKTAFFEVVRTHTILGFLGPRSYGGNRGGVGWAHIGVEDRMIFQPPFGYYDAEAMKDAE